MVNCHYHQYKNERNNENVKDFAIIPGFFIIGVKITEFIEGKLKSLLSILKFFIKPNMDSY